MRLTTIRLLTIVLTLYLAAPAWATNVGGRAPHSGKTSRIDRGPNGTKSYYRRGGVQAIKLHVVRTKSGAVRRLNQTRKVAEVVTDSKGLDRYLNHVSKNTVELIYNPHGSSNGHMLVRAGSKVYELGNTRSANARSFSSLASGRSGMVGAVYRVNPEQIPAIQQRLQTWVDGARNNNFPVFDGYGKPINLKPQTGFFAKGYVVSSKGKRRFRANGNVNAKLVQIPGAQALLQSKGGKISFPVLAQKKDGTIKVDTLTCTSFVIRALAETAPQLKLGTLGDFSQRFARSAIVKLVRGKAPVTPDLVTVYNNRPGASDIRLMASEIGKSGK